VQQLLMQYDVSASLCQYIYLPNTLRSHTEPVCFLKINVGAFLVYYSQNAITDQLISLVLLVTLLSCISTAAGNSFKILFLSIFAKILAIDKDLSCML